MNKLIVLVLTFALSSATTFIGCSEQKLDTRAEAETLKQISREWSKLASTDSIENILNYWADDAIIFSTGRPPVEGKKALREMVMGSLRTPGFKISWEPLSAYVSKGGDLAYIIEQNQITVNDSSGKPITIYGRGVTVWRKDSNGSWKNVVESIPPLPSKNK